MLIARKVARQTLYIWQYSLDQKAWTDAGETFQAKTRIAGLTPDTTYWFRFQVQTRHGKGDWSRPLRFHVD